MSSRKLFPLLALLLVGCVRASTYSMVYLPDGSRGSVITCHRRVECFTLASKGCGGSYTIISMEDGTIHPADADNPEGDLIPTNDFNPSHRGTEFVIRCTPKETP